VSLKKAMKHSDKLFVLRVPDLTPQQATDITAFANKIKDSGYNYRGIVEFIPFMVTRQMCSLNPFSADFRQQCVSGLAKAQLSCVGEGDKKSWFCSEFVTDAFAKAGHPLTLAQSGWISPADLMHMRTGDVSAFKPETQLQYVGHLKPGIYIKAGRFVGLTR
ncbi:YaeF family permuted papain-like enzyme, partial [Escherichia coli]|nr:YaeF family permuted papain-like enzyme [Escherichia coli]